jgi:ribonuclease III
LLLPLTRFLLFPFYRKKKFLYTLTDILGFLPSNIRLYEMAFIHKSASVTLPGGELINNERLEYLGDAILDAIVANYLFRHYPKKDEGSLTKMRSRMVKRKHLNLIAYRLGVNKLLISHTNPSNISKHLYGNTFEALIGAIYLDKGFLKTQNFIEKILKKHVDVERLLRSDSDYKSQLIEWAQKSKQEIIFASQEEIKGDTHVPQFVATIKIFNLDAGKGYGYSKKDAEQKAAKAALEYLHKIDTKQNVKKL